MTCTIELGTTLPELRANLQAYFSGLLGTYTLPDGTTTPAVRVKQVPSDWRVSGAELAIERSPDRQLLGARFGSITAKRIWTLAFTQFNPEESLDPIRLRAFRAFPHAVSRRTPETDDTYERLIIELPDSVLITIP